MPISECHLDAPQNLVRVFKHAFTGDIGGVQFVDGVAQSGMARSVADRMAGIFGADFAIVGPWEPAPVAAEVPTVPEPAPTPPHPEAVPEAALAPSIPQPIEPFARASRAHRGR